MKAFIVDYIKKEVKYALEFYRSDKQICNEGILGKTTKNFPFFKIKVVFGFEFLIIQGNRVSTTSDTITIQIGSIDDCDNEHGFTKTDATPKITSVKSKKQRTSQKKNNKKNKRSIANNRINTTNCEQKLIISICSPSNQMLYDLFFLIIHCRYNHNISAKKLMGTIQTYCQFLFSCHDNCCYCDR